MGEGKIALSVSTGTWALRMPPCAREGIRDGLETQAAPPFSVFKKASPQTQGAPPPKVRSPHQAPQG